LRKRILRADFDSRNLRGGEARGDIGGDIKHRVARAAGGEKSLVRRIVLEEAADKGPVDLIRGAADTGANGGGDACAAGAKFLHRVERRLGDAGDGALPPGMGGTDDPRFLVDE